MPAYATFEDLIIRYPVVKTWGKTDTEVNSGLIHFAERQLDGMLASAFTVPFVAAHPTVIDLTIDIAYARAMLRIDPEKAKEIRFAVLSRVKALKNGGEYLVTGSGTIAPSGTDDTVWSSTENFHPTHSMLDAENVFTHISSAMLEFEENLRT